MTLVAAVAPTPSMFAPVSTPAFAIRELPGDLEDEERVVFIERLMQEGLVIRKEDLRSRTQSAREKRPPGT